MRSMATCAWTLSSAPASFPAAGKAPAGAHVSAHAAVHRGDQGPRRVGRKCIEATLTADGDQTIQVVEEQGIPLNLLAAYGDGIQVHIDDLAAHLAGRERGDSDARMNELYPLYQDLAARKS